MNSIRLDNIEPLPTEINNLKELLVDCYRLAFEIPKKIDVYNENPLQIISSCLFIKVINATRAILVLFENNLLSEVHVLLRHEMEAIFVLKACYEDKQFLKEYINSDILYRLKMGNVISQNQNNFKENEEFDIERIKSLKSDLKLIVDENGIKEVKIESLAKKAKMESYYDTAYRFLSNIVHIGIKSLDDYLKVDEKRKVRELLIYPYQKEIPTLFITAIELILIALDCINIIFKIGNEETILSLKKRLNELAKSYLPR